MYWYIRHGVRSEEGSPEAAARTPEPPSAPAGGRERQLRAPKIRCGKARCRCNTSDQNQWHGPYWYTFMERSEDREEALTLRRQTLPTPRGAAAPPRAQRVAASPRRPGARGAARASSRAPRPSPAPAIEVRGGGRRARDLAQRLAGRRQEGLAEARRRTITRTGSGARRRRSANTAPRRLTRRGTRTERAGVGRRAPRPRLATGTTFEHASYQE